MSARDLLAEEKLFYERFYALHRDPALLSVCQRFGIEAFRRSSVLEGFAAFLDDHAFRGRRCVEIGTYNGLTAIVLARFFERVISIDIEPRPLKHEIAAHLAIANVHFIDAPDNEAKASAIARLAFDAAFVDGDHAHDTALDFALVRRCKRVLFHEYWPAQPPVWDLVNALKASGTVITQGKFALWTG